MENFNLTTQIPPTFVYPSNIATRLDISNLDKDDLQKTIIEIKKHLPNRSIINVYGLSGSGKGTLSKALANSLSISCLDSGQIFRALTFAFNHTGLEINVVNTANLLNQIKITLADSKLSFSFDNQLLGLDELRSTHVNNRIADISSKDYVQLAYFDKIYEIIDDYALPVVLDGRGGKPPHLIKAEANGYKVIKILLEVNNQVNFERQRAEKISKERQLTSTFVPDVNFETKVLQDFVQGYHNRNQKDIDWMTKMDIGVIVPGAIIDTSYLTPDQVLLLSANYLLSQLRV